MSPWYWLLWAAVTSVNVALLVASVRNLRSALDVLDMAQDRLDDAEAAS